MYPMSRWRCSPYAESFNKYVAVNIWTHTEISELLSGGKCWRVVVRFRATPVAINDITYVQLAVRSAWR